jgi:mannose-6-phosphate isomerase-like protein (cupin superfamily)
MSTRKVVENPASGERIVVLRTGADTGGTLLEFELHLAPGGHVPSGHIHPEQEERFTVLEGLARFRLGIRTVMVGAGETITVRPGTPHRFANAGPGPARLLVQVRPALNMEELLETAAALTRESSPVLAGRPRLLDLALFLREFEREVRAPVLPALMSGVFRSLAWLARSAGRDGRYRRLRGLTAASREPS